MEILACLLTGVIIGFVLGRSHAKEEVKEANRAKWRRYSLNKRQRKAASRGN